MFKQTVLLCFVLLSYLFTPAQGWTDTELQSANTARDIQLLTTAEKETILYLNLCRLYPKKFAKLEVENYTAPPEYGDYLKNSAYVASLLKELNSRQPVKALAFDTTLYQHAKCFAQELGTSGRMTHDHLTCKKGNYAECLSFGMQTGKDIALQWLIDHDVESLGHRQICLDDSYHKIGVSIHAHTESTTCAVAEIIW